jgi:hypothetical protein
MDHPVLTGPVDWRVTFRDAETDERINVRVSADGSDAAIRAALRMVDQGDVGQGRKWLCFDSCETLPDRGWAASSGRLGYLQRALRRPDAELQGRRDGYLGVARQVAADIIDRGV